MFSELVVCYLFLGGAGAGACLVLSVMGILVPRIGSQRVPYVAFSCLGSTENYLDLASRLPLLPLLLASFSFSSTLEGQIGFYCYSQVQRWFTSPSEHMRLSSAY